MCLDGGDDQYDVVSGDARIARIMQEQERLEAMMHQEKKRIRRAQRERQQREQLVLVSVVTAWEFAIVINHLSSSVRKLIVLS